MNRRQVGSLLPDVVQRCDVEGTPMRAMLELMVDMLAPVREELNRVHENLAPRVARDRFVGMLARWVDVDAVLYDIDGTVLARKRALPTLPTGIGRLREVVGAAAELARWRGTRRGLIRYLEAATGVTGFEVEELVDEGRGPRPFFFRVSAPSSVRPHAALVRRILELEKPAYVQCELRFVNDEVGP